MFAYESLEATGLPSCHRLHYLQMWLEKLCKAYLWLPDETKVELRSRHQVVATVLPRLVTERWRKLAAFARKPNIDSLRRICSEIDRLHPQIDDGGRRPDNVEYPWRDDGKIIVPCNFKFAVVRQIYGSPGRELLKASSKLTRDPTLLQP